ncbi:DUF3667 domain-containing protein [Maribellus sp. CM-23]|uniref:DUF3667 domain-containing protein n=1 Tax=Maribellus sp. CM-23 TaxID=2781026 RepID=UPI001F3C0468|nr:DUF3667 domain-containing protein [Maribellus sp. CM-23]MCE4563380.1 DUF3667 domain-containing protein [Maribellus sp. CM-23]
MKPDQPEISQCPNCQSHSIDNYCSQCGQKIYRKRFTFRGFFEVLGNALNIDRGFIYTLIWMFRNPGKVVNDYLNGKTRTYFNPLNYILVIAGIYAFLIIWLNIIDTNYETTNHLLHPGDAFASPEEEELRLKWFEFAKRYTNLIPLLMIPFVSLFSKWFYSKRKLFYGEHLIINTFIFAQNVLISILLIPAVLTSPTMLKLFPFINLCCTLLYFSYAYFRIFRQSVIVAAFKAFAIYIGGFVGLMLLISLLVLVTTAVSNMQGIDLVDWLT